MSQPRFTDFEPLRQRLLDAEKNVAILTDACDSWEHRYAALEQVARGLRDTLKGARTNVAYAHQPENCGDHCRNNCRDCVLANTLEDIDAALAAADARTALKEAKDGK